jgi:hypothetical protein
MKIRTGFVSNSSSSSFLLACAKVNMKNVAQFYEWKNKIEAILKKSSIEIIDVKQYDFSDSYDYKLHNNMLEIESFDDCLMVNVNPEDELIVTINYCGNEGDGEFYDDEDGYCNYDKVDLDWFDGEYQDIINDFAVLKDIFSNYEYKCGAGRNG